MLPGYLVCRISSRENMLKSYTKINNFADGTKLSYYQSITTDKISKILTYDDMDLSERIMNYYTKRIDDGENTAEKAKSKVYNLIIKHKLFVK